MAKGLFFLVLIALGSVLFLSLQVDARRVVSIGGRKGKVGNRLLVDARSSRSLKNEDEEKGEKPGHAPGVARAENVEDGKKRVKFTPAPPGVGHPENKPGGGGCTGDELCKEDESDGGDEDGECEGECDEGDDGGDENGECEDGKCDEGNDGGDGDEDGKCDEGNDGGDGDEDGQCDEGDDGGDEDDKGDEGNDGGDEDDKGDEGNNGGDEDDKGDEGNDGGDEDDEGDEGDDGGDDTQTSKRSLKKPPS